MNSQKLIEGIDFNWEEIKGTRFKVFTAHYLLNRGYCCGNKCRNCPYNNKTSHEKRDK